jgi:2-(3-amino-3-carboxypropyl)histidine synthase
MTNIDFDLELVRVISIIRKNEYKAIAIQYPEGLKLAAQSMSGYIEKEGATAILMADPCFGPCDLALDFKDVGAEALFHIGHAELPSLKAPDNVYFIEARAGIDAARIIEKAIPMLAAPVGLLTTVQHAGELEKVKAMLSENGVDAVIGKGGSRITYPGQLLGCNFSAARAIEHEVSSFLYVGGGRFHPLGVSLITEKPVIAVDPYTGMVEDVADIRDAMLKKRYGQIGAAKKARSFGVLIGRKAGQNQFRLAMAVKKIIQKSGRSAVLIAINHFAPDFLLAYDVDAFVSTACPRIAIEDSGIYPKPMLTPTELEMVLGKRDMEKYQLDEIQ